jgi:hypothetical protein
LFHQPPGSDQSPERFPALAHGNSPPPSPDTPDCLRRGNASQTACAIDHLGKEPGVSEETSLWLWQFTICAGRARTDDSERIVRCASEVLQLAVTSPERLLAVIAPRFAGPFGARVLDEWVLTLRTIIDIARRHPTCSWTSPDAS